MEETVETIFRGLPISKGIGIGTPVFFFDEHSTAVTQSISDGEVEIEIIRYRSALKESRGDLEQLREKVMSDGGAPEVVSILGSHLELIEDPMMTTVVEEKIRTLLCKPESAFHHLLEEYKQRFRAVEDTYFQERFKDLIDVSRRVIGHLSPLQEMKKQPLPDQSVILAHELVPSDTIEVNPSSVTAFVTAVGGITSHAAIIARAKGIPYVANIDIKAFKRLKLESLIVDGSRGLVIVNPSSQTLQKYRNIQQKNQESSQLLNQSLRLKAETVDGYEIRIFANLENPKEIDQLLHSGAEGVGLFRTEYLFLSKKHFPTEEEQYQVYRGMASALEGKPLVIRVFDIGGDKKPDLNIHDPAAKYFSILDSELNPALGCRAIRLLLRNPELLRAQIRAILRASAHGEIHLLLPMVADLSELRHVRELVKAIRSELEGEGIEVGDELPIGSMIEVPSSAIMCDAIARESDFLSIGTNDLSQYVLAADRGNPNTASLYPSTHPSILRLIRMVVSSAQNARKPVILCGECAADPAMIPILIGLGIREFSVALRHIPLVKHTLRKWRIVEACRVAESALEQTAAQDLSDFLAAETVRD